MSAEVFEEILKGQEAVMNELTYQQYQDRREDYKKDLRWMDEGYSKVVSDARKLELKVADFLGEGVSYLKARELAEKALADEAAVQAARAAEAAEGKARPGFFGRLFGRK